MRTLYNGEVMSSSNPRHAEIFVRSLMFVEAEAIDRRSRSPKPSSYSLAAT